MATLSSMQAYDHINGKFPPSLDEFTEFEQRQYPVPNHLLESKNFNRLGRNLVVQVSPSILNFAGFKPGKTYRKVVRLCNASAEVQIAHILPPESQFFAIKYTKHGRFLPGTILEISVQFMPDKWRYYYDCIRIHCKGGDNLIIPIHGFPVVDTSKFPKKVHFTSPNNRLGHVVSKSIPLVSNCPIAFEYEIAILQSHPAFTITPLTGTIPGHGRMCVNVDYYPTEYSTAHMKMQLITSQFAAEPQFCEVIGVCSPNLPRISTPQMPKSIKDSDKVFKNSKVFDPRALDPLHIARSRQSIDGRPGTSKGLGAGNKVVQRGGYVKPSNLMAQHGVNSVLTQTKGKLRLKDLREMPAHGHGDQKDDDGDEISSSSNSRQIKQAEFERLIQQDVIKERANQLKWQVHLGSNAMTAKQMKAVKRARMQQHEVYETQVKHSPKKEFELERMNNQHCVCKTRRQSTDTIKVQPTFDLYKNNSWSKRQKALFRFKQAVGTIIVRLEANRKIVHLRRLIKQFRAWQQSRMTFSSVDSLHNKLPPSPMFHIKVHNPTTKDNAQQNFQLSFTEPKISCNSSMQFTDAFSSGIDVSTTVTLPSASKCASQKYRTKELSPYFDLCVPKYYENAAYDRQNMEECFRNYIPPKFARNLRTGAKDEVIYAPVTEDSNKQISASIEVEEVSGELATQLSAPLELFRNPPQHSLHIFNRAPGLVLYPLPLPLSEVDTEFHICPEPKSRMDPSSDKQPYLDKDDVIKGMMSWKRFNSQGLKALSSIPTLTDAWLPRRHTPFSNHILPNQLPPFLTQLPEDDRFCCGPNEEDDDEVAKAAPIMVTPAMVSGNFAGETKVREEADQNAELESPRSSSFPESEHLPPSNIAVNRYGPVARDQRLKELEEYLQLQKHKIADLKSSHHSSLSDS